MGEHLGLTRLADKSTGERKPILDEDGKPVRETVLTTDGVVTRDAYEPWPLAGVAITSGPPKSWEPSDRFVAEALAEIDAGAPAWLKLEGQRLHTTSIRVPSGPQAGTERAYERGMVVTGDAFVLTLTEARRDKRGVPVDGSGKPVTFRYRIDEAPGIYLDADEPSGYRVSHGYRCTLVKGKGE